MEVGVGKAKIRLRTIFRWLLNCKRLGAGVVARRTFRLELHIHVVFVLNRSDVRNFNTSYPALAARIDLQVEVRFCKIAGQEWSVGR